MTVHVQKPEQVLELARQHLEKYQPREYRLEVLADGIRQEDDWWYVLVRPSRDDIRAYDYAGRLAEAEQDLRDASDVKVLLVPVLPD
jgi:3-deoxy-D-arabino-heptulosonate 7-phosphate (DAHP) synthase